MSDKSDYVFLPHAIGGGDRDNPKLYCYYSNYAVALVQNIDELKLSDKCLSPIIDFSKPMIQNVRQIYESLPDELRLIQTPNDIQKAYSEAWTWFLEQKQQLIQIFQHQKPYLILQIDEHGSDVGYETRIEAAIRSFRNHYQQKHEPSKVKHHQGVRRTHDKQGTILIPNYDPLSGSLICAAFENAGYQALVIEETETSIQIFATEFDMQSLPIELIYNVYCAYLLGGFLRKIACKVRPYELIAGYTDRVIKKSLHNLYQGIARGEAKEEVFMEIVTELAAIPISEAYGTRPKVGIIGDLYVRDNDVFNQQLITEMENYGAEVITTPFSYIIRMLAVKHNYLLREHKNYLKLLTDKLFVDMLEKFERRFFEIANKILQEDFPVFDESIFHNLEKYNLSLQHGGETAQNVMKIFSLMNHYPDLKLLIHVNPIFCCPALVSESIFKKVEKDIGIPIVSIIYDGTAANRNEVLAPYLHYITENMKRAENF